jgi:hypothetical protein
LGSDSPIEYRASLGCATYSPRNWLHVQWLKIEPAATGDGHTELARAVYELNIERICANSSPSLPQAIGHDEVIVVLAHHYFLDVVSM